MPAAGDPAIPGDVASVSPPMQDRTTARVDITIAGAGIAGLWLRAVLHHAGFSVLLLEKHAIGGVQTSAAQGIVHGGLKYALGASVTRASEAAAAMPARWRRLRAGDGVPDLRAVPLLSDCVHLFADAGIEGRLVSFFASRSLHGRVERVTQPAYPSWLQAQQSGSRRFRGQVYRLDDFVLDVDALVDALAAAPAGPILHGELTSIEPGRASLALAVRAPGPRAAAAPSLHIDTQRLLLCAGAGNEALLALAGQAMPAMQRRPLHQVWAHAPRLPAVFAHCITGARAAEPRLTITTHRTADGMCWSLGGALATQGVHRDAAAQASATRAELAACLPWLDLPDLHIETRRVDRAEPQTDGGNRPDHAFLHQQAGILTCWPTKLTMAPDLGDRVLAALGNGNLRPREDVHQGSLQALPTPPRGRGAPDDTTQARR